MAVKITPEIINSSKDIFVKHKINAEKIVAVGSGTSGTAYAYKKKVLKITQCSNEASAVDKIIRTKRLNSHKHIARYHDIHYDDANCVYLIVMEKLSHPEELREMWLLASNIRNQVIGYIPWERITFKKFRQELELKPHVKIDDKMLLFIRDVIIIHRECVKHFGHIADLFYGNVCMDKRGRLKRIDIR